MTSTDTIPVVDFSSILSGSTDLTTCPEVKEIQSAFSTVGFVFLKNHGIKRELVSFKMYCPIYVHLYRLDPGLLNDI